MELFRGWQWCQEFQAHEHLVDIEKFNGDKGNLEAAQHYAAEALSAFDEYKRNLRMAMEIRLAKYPALKSQEDELKANLKDERDRVQKLCAKYSKAVLRQESDALIPAYSYKRFNRIATGVTRSDSSA